MIFKICFCKIGSVVNQRNGYAKHALNQLHVTGTELFNFITAEDA